MKKILATTLTTTILTLSSGAVFADSTTCSSVTTIAGLGTCIDSVYHATKSWINNQNFQQIPNVTQTTTTNTSTVQIQNATSNSIPGGFATQTGTITLSPSEAAAYNAAQNTQHNLKNSLLQFYYGVNQDDTTLMKNFDAAGTNQPYKTYMDLNSPIALSGLTTTSGTQASDTLYSADTNSLGSTAYQTHKKWLQKPPATHNNYFDFSTLITPIAYTETEQTAASYFLKYAAQSTQNLTEGVNFTKLYANPSALYALKNNPVYQNYVLTLRNMLAVRSISMTILNQLIAERTPLPGLAGAAGLPQVGQAEASPLQVEKYQATHDLNNPNWYSTVAQESPATVQRELLITMKEIEKQNYQAHLDREQILAALTAANLQSNSASMSAMLLQETSKLNTAITNAINASKPAPKPTTTTPNGTTEKFTPGS